MMNLRFGYVTVAAAPLGERSQAGSASDYAGALRAIGGEPWEFSNVADPAPLVVLVETGGTERTIMDLWRRRLETAAKAPMVLVAHSGANSLPASLEALARLRQDGHKGRILCLTGPEDEDGLAGVRAAVRDVDAWRQLRQSRIGVVGSPSGWLVASNPDPAIVRTTWGPTSCQSVPTSSRRPSAPPPATRRAPGRSPSRREPRRSGSPSRRTSQWPSPCPRRFSTSRRSTA